MRAEPVKEITDKGFLAGTAVRDPDMHVCMKAVEKIDDQTVLSSVAENDGKPKKQFASQQDKAVSIGAVRVTGHAWRLNNMFFGETCYE